MVQQKIISEATYKACAKFLISKLKASSRTPEEKGQRYGRKDKLIVNITEEQLIFKLKKIGFRCEITLKPFPQFETASEYLQTKLRKNINPYFFPSCDRIDSKKGYSINNIQIVCVPINKGKGDGLQKDFIEFFNFKSIKTNQMKSNLKSAKEEVLLYLVQNAPELAASYYESEFGVSVKVNKTSSSEAEYKKTRDEKCKLEFQSLVRSVPNINTKQHINISAKFTNSKGYIDNTRLMTSAIGTIVRKNKLEVLQMKAPRRGFIYYISRKDYNQYIGN